MNHLMVHHAQISLIATVNKFVERVDGKKQVFGQSTYRDLSMKIPVAHKDTQGKAIE